VCNRLSVTNQSNTRKLEKTTTATLPKKKTLSGYTKKKLNEHILLVVFDENGEEIMLVFLTC
jgi:hypothetical protein